MFYPPKDFERAYAALMEVLAEHGFTCHGLDIDRGRQDVLGQRKQRLEFDLLEMTYRQAQAQLVADQYERYQRFLSFLGAARALFRQDPVMLAVLDQFKRKSTRRRSEADEADVTTAAPTLEANERDPEGAPLAGLRGEQRERERLNPALMSTPPPLDGAGEREGPGARDEAHGLSRVRA